MRDKSGTRDWFFHWGGEFWPLCLSCVDGIECQDHLFFPCPFRLEVWEGVVRLLWSSHCVTAWFRISFTIKLFKFQFDTSPHYSQFPLLVE